MTISAKALLEIYELTSQAQTLAHGTTGDRKKADGLIARAAAIRSAEISSDEAREQVANALAESLGLPVVDHSKRAKEQRAAERLFKEFLRGRGPKELRQLAAGEQTISWTEGPQGGYLVPSSFAESVILGLNKLSPLLSADAVTMVVTADGRPRPTPGIDLTAISGALIAENVQTNPVSPPLVMSKMLGAWSFKSNPIAASFEFEEDSFLDTLQLLSTVFSVGLGRAISPYLQTGTGVNQPTGLYTAIQNNSPAVTTASATAATANEILDLYHSVDALHRESPKCAWVMSDKNWLTIRQTAATLGGADTSSWRFMMSQDDDSALMGKPVLIDNSMASGPSSPIIFGDLSHYVIRLTDLRVRRNLESAYVVNYQALYTALIRCDANLIAPGNDVPVQYALFYS